MGRTPNTPLSNVATSSSPNNLNWESAKHACLDRKNITKPPLPAEVMHDLQRMPRNLTNSDLPTQKDTGAKSKAIKIVKDKLNVRYKGIQATVDKNTKKRIDQVARKTLE